MEIKAKATCDLESMKALTHLWMFKKADPKKRMIMWTVLYAILLAVIVFEMVAFGVSEIMIALVCVLVFTYLLECYWYFILPGLKYKAMVKLKDVTNEYTFCDDMMHTVTKSDEYSGESEIKYTAIYKVYETSKYFFIYQNKNQVLLVDKRTFDKGDDRVLREKLLLLLGKKYIICNY